MRDLAWRVYARVWEDEILDRAAGLSYYFSFALLPTLLFLTSLFGMLPLPGMMSRLLDYADHVLPGDAASLLRKTLAGVVKDATGAVLPGVTIEAASPALIEKSRTVTTDSQGQYKIVDLRPGTYTVTFTLVGFNTVKREGIILTADFTAVSAPLPGLIRKRDTLLLPLFVTYTNLPVGSTAIPVGFEPAANGEPSTAASAPVVSTRYAETEALP